MRPFGNATATICDWHRSLALRHSSSGLRGATNHFEIPVDASHMYDLWQVALKALRAVHNTAAHSETNFDWKNCKTFPIYILFAFWFGPAQAVPAAWKISAFRPFSCHFWAFVLSPYRVTQALQRLFDTFRRSWEVGIALLFVVWPAKFCAEVCMWFATAIHEADHGTSKHWRLPVNVSQLRFSVVSIL